MRHLRLYSVSHARFFTALRTVFRACLLLCCVGAVFALDGCRRKKNSADLFTFSPPSQNVWVGYFRFDEYGGGDIGEENPTAIFVGHTLTVRQSIDDSLRANLSASGFRHSSDLDCTVEEVDDTLHVYFYRYGENHDSTLGKYKDGELLLSLVREKYTVLTYWQSYKPAYTPFTVKRQGTVYFMKDNEDAVPNVDVTPFEAFWTEYVQTLKARDSVKITYMTSFPLVGSNYVRPEGALTDIVSRTDFMTNYQVALFPALRKVMETKLSRDFTSSIKTKKDNVYLPNGVVPEGVQVYRLTVNSQELRRYTTLTAEQISDKAIIKEQSDILKRQNKIAKELQTEYAWAILVARIQGKYRVCYMGVAPKVEE
jgi:Family of unknown function (DUF5991)